MKKNNTFGTIFLMNTFGFILLMCCLITFFVILFLLAQLYLHDEILGGIVFFTFVMFVGSFFKSYNDYRKYKKGPYNNDIQNLQR